MHARARTQQLLDSHQQAPSLCSCVLLGSAKLAKLGINLPRIFRFTSEIRFFFCFSNRENSKHPRHIMSHRARGGRHSGIRKQNITITGSLIFPGGRSSAPSDRRQVPLPPCYSEAAIFVQVLPLAIRFFDKEK